MKLDAQGREDVFAFLKTQGYTGTLEQWWDEVRRQTYHSEIRIFERVWLDKAFVGKAPEAGAFLRWLLRLATPHFNSARVCGDGVPEVSFTFNREEARRQEHTPRPLRLDGLCLDIEFRDDQVQVRCCAYVNNEFRRNRYFTFKPESRKGHPQ